MTHIPFVPINLCSSSLNHTWRTDEWQKLSKELNITNDERIERIQLMRFNVLRQHRMRDAKLKRLYWDRLNDNEQLIAEAEREYFSSLYKDLFALEMMILDSEYLDMDLESFDHDKMVKGVHENKLLLDLPNHLSPIDIEYNISESFIPHTAVAANTYNESLIRPSEVIAFPFIPKRTTITANATTHSLWLNRLGPLQQRITTSTQRWHQELLESDNALSGAGSKGRTLLVNTAIPLVNDMTFLAWFSASGIGLRGLEPKESVHNQRMCGFYPTHQLTFMLPMLPATKEHRNGGGIMGDDSHTDHSLTSKSGAHKRLESGALLHGLWLARTVFMNTEGYTHEVATTRIQDANIRGVAIQTTHNSMIGSYYHMPDRFYTARRNYDQFLYGMDWEEAKRLTGWIMDPWMVQPHPMPFLHAMQLLPFDVTYRGIGKFMRVHFRFDDDMLGQAAANDWIESFTSACARYISMTESEVSRVEFETALKIQNYAAASPKVVEKVNRVGKHKYDLTSLFGDSKP